jgi:hypothetical protein
MVVTLSVLLLHVLHRKRRCLYAKQQQQQTGQTSWGGNSTTSKHEPLLLPLRLTC